MKLNAHELNEITQELQLRCLHTWRKMIKQEVQNYCIPFEKREKLAEPIVSPLRHYEPWSSGERTSLVNQCKEGLSIMQMAAQHERTQGAIICQLKREWQEGKI